MTFSVFAAADESPDRMALIVGGQTLTFHELAARVTRSLAWLAEHGVTPDGTEPVALVGRSDLATLCLVYALLEMGRPMALVHPRLTAAERQATVDLARPALVVDRAPSNETGDFAPHRHPLSSHSENPKTRIDPESCLAVLFTSGTTGEPKGVLLSRRAFAASARASAANLGFGDDERWLLGLPIAHVGGLSVITRCLLARRTVVVPDEVARGERLTMEGLARTLERDRVTLVSLVPTQLEWLLAMDPPWKMPATLRAVLLGGAAARPALLEQARERGVPVLTTYGLTEACSQVTAARYGAIRTVDEGAGEPIQGTEVRILDGVIAVRGPTLFSGYLTRNGATHPLDADGFFHTDDVGRLDAEGSLHVLGRRSDLIVTGGENVYPAEVEAVLERHPGVASACVFGIPDDTWGQLVAVAIVPADGNDLPADLANFVNAHLATHRKPRRVATFAALAITPGGKLDRRETARLAIPLLQPLEGP